MGWVLLVGVALAFPDGGGVVVPRTNSLTLRVSEGAEVEVLPSVTPGQGELLVRGNHLDLKAQLAGQKIDGVRGTHASDLGGAWLVVVGLADPDTRLAVDHHGPVVVGEVRPGVDRPLPPPRNPAPGVDALLAGDVPTPPCTSVHLPLEALQGADMTYGLASDDYVPELPRWTKAEPTTTSWDEVAATRGRTWVARTAKETATFGYRLGALFRNLGHAREAAYYFGGAMESGGGSWEIGIQRAGAFLSIHRYAEALTAADAAWRMGAPEEAVLEVLGAVSLATGSPPPAPTGRALAGASGRAEPLLLAGALLLRDRCPVEAAPILAVAADRLPAGRRPLARMMLADAWLGAGDLKGAALALAVASPAGEDPRWVELKRVRSRQLSMLRDNPDKWAQMVPALQRAGAGYSVEAIESLHLVAQVHLALGDDRSAIEAWSLLLCKRRGPWDGVPAERLRTTFLSRLQRLFAQDRLVDAVSLYEAVWRPELLPRMADPAPLRRVAAAYLDFGLPRRALAITQDVWAIEGRDGLDDRDTTLSLAQLYAALGEDAEARETLRFLRTARTLDPATRGRVDLLEGDVLAHQGDRAGARAAYLAAAASPPVAGDAAIRRARLDAEEGNCAEAIPDLRAGRASATGLSAADEALLARCLERGGSVPEAALAARSAAEHAVDPGFKEWIGWVADRLGAPVAPAPAAGDAPPAAVATAGGTWSRLQAEEDAQRAFDERIRARRAPAP